MQVLVASNSNKPGGGGGNPRKSDSGTNSSDKDSNNLQNQTKFKSLGDLHMEKGLPPAPRYTSKFARITRSKDRLVKRLSLYVTDNL